MKIFYQTPLLVEEHFYTEYVWAMNMGVRRCTIELNDKLVSIGMSVMVECEMNSSMKSKMTDCISC